MNLKPDKTSFTDEEHEALRADIAAELDARFKQAHLAREAEVSAPTLSQYLGGKYAGDNDDIAARLTKWLNARRRTREHEERLPVSPEYQPLQTSKEIALRLRFAREAGRMVSICGQPGVSKTSTAIQLRHETPRTWLATMDPSTRGVNTCLVAILEAMGEADARGTPQALARRILNRAMAATCLIIIDEAQHLSDQAVEQLRAINDRARAQGCRVGIALMGNQLAFSRVAHDGSRPAFAQVSSRMAQRMWIVKPAPADVTALAEAWAAENREVLTEAARRYCLQIADHPGGLRNIEMAMESALMAAWGAKQPLDVEHLQWAFASQSGLGRAA